MSIAWTSLMLAVLFLAAKTVTGGSVAICLRRTTHFLLLSLLTGVLAYPIRLESSQIWTRFYCGTKWLIVVGEVGKVSASQPWHDCQIGFR